jgi:hypothetical protein
LEPLAPQLHEVSAAGLYRASGHRAPRKTAHAIGQDRPDVLRLRQDWFDGQSDLEPERLIFITGTWTATIMARSHGNRAKAERSQMGFPCDHRHVQGCLGTP